jgi:microcin C transport system substrate-binding protein
LSLFGDVKYPEGFKHFEYVNPKAPQGGSVRQSASGTFDNFNMVVSGVKGSIAAGTELFTETLTTASLDEVSTEYGLLAEAVSYPDDHSNVTYRLRANARWHDGKPITADDVLFSFDALKKNSPFYGAYKLSASCPYCRSTGGKEPTNPAESVTSRRRRSSRRSAQDHIA